MPLEFAPIVASAISENRPVSATWVLAMAAWVHEEPASLRGLGTTEDSDGLGGDSHCGVDRYLRMSGDPKCRVIS